ncbi:hypothetical protein ACIPW5_33930 [Streptomyces sp. NPDC090077]|uniref:hypothetical protein n=1 Tax=Streptomyces sp. NPDC090077 TaxID=3365938 RepID=UPI003813CDD6
MGLQNILKNAQIKAAQSMSGDTSINENYDGDFATTFNPLVENAAAAVFTEAQFKGQRQTLPVGRYDIGDLTVPDDSISSVLVPEGLKVTLFEDAGFSGASTVIETDTEAFGANLENKVSSVIVEKI